jgi:hypothetical protein
MNEYRFIKIRIFGNEKCEMCQRIKNELKSISLPFEFIDAMLDENQDICDRYSVEKLPHIQAFIDNSEKIVYEHRGYIQISLFINNIQKIISKNSKLKVDIKSNKCESCAEKNKLDISSSVSSLNSVYPEPKIDFLN